MEPLAGIVVEYLVVGSTSALWILILLASYGRLPTALPDPFLVVLIPLLYVFGMLSDRLGRYVVEWRKHQIEAAVIKKEDYHKVSSQDVSSRLVAHQPALAAQLEARRTRDRISRGVVANVPFVTLAVGVWLAGVVRARTVVAGGVLLFIVAWRMWERFQRLSSSYEIHCDRRLEELRSSAASPTGSASR